MGKTKWLLPVGVLTVAGLAVLSISLLKMQAPKMGEVRNDVVQGQNGKSYRRTVQLSTDAIKHTVTTTITFTDTVTGGIGVASYTQPDLPPDNFLKQMGRAVSMRMNRPVTMPNEFPLMQLSQPIAAGQKWNVIVHNYGGKGWWVEGKGKAPQGASLQTLPSQVAALRTTADPETLYGLGKRW